MLLLTLQAIYVPCRYCSIRRCCCAASPHLPVHHLPASVRHSLHLLLVVVVAAGAVMHSPHCPLLLRAHYCCMGSFSAHPTFSRFLSSPHLRQMLVSCRSVLPAARSCPLHPTHVPFCRACCPLFPLRLSSTCRTCCSAGATWWGGTSGTRSCSTAPTGAWARGEGSCRCCRATATAQVG